MILFYYLNKNSTMGLSLSSYYYPLINMDNNPTEKEIRKIEMHNYQITMKKLCDNLPNNYDRRY